MKKITPEFLTGFEYQLFWGTEDETIFIFQEDNTGVMKAEEDPVGFEWKINEQGVLALFFSDEIYYWKVLDKEGEGYTFQEYKNVNKKPEKTKTFIALSGNFDEIENEIVSENKEAFKDIIKDYNVWNYSIISFGFLILYSVLFLIFEMIVIVKDFQFMFKFITISLIVLYYSRGFFFLFHKLSYKIRAWIEK